MAAVLCSPLAFQADAFEVAAGVGVDADEFSGSDEEWDEQLDSVVEDGLLPRGVLSRVLRRRGLSHRGFDDRRQCNGDGIVVAELYR